MWIPVGLDEVIWTGTAEGEDKKVEVGGREEKQPGDGWKGRVGRKKKGLESESPEGESGQWCKMPQGLSSTGTES